MTSLYVMKPLLLVGCRVQVKLAAGLFHHCTRNGDPVQATSRFMVTGNSVCLFRRGALKAKGAELQASFFSIG